MWRPFSLEEFKRVPWVYVKTENYFYSMNSQRFKFTVVNQAKLSLHAGSLEIMLIVPSIMNLRTFYPKLVHGYENSVYEFD